MIVLGADMHKSSHTLAAVVDTTGELRGEKTIGVGDQGFAVALDWARGIGDERLWALEDCRHVSGACERFLLVHGERVVRIGTRLMAGARRGGRDRGKSDLIDAIAVARAALREGVESLPVAQLAGVELDLRLLVDHRERLVHRAPRSMATCSGICTTSGQSSRCPAARCSQRSGARELPGGRQLNTAIHRIAVTRARCHPETKAYIERKTRRGQDQPRRHPLPQAPPRPPHLAPPAAAPRPSRTTPNIKLLT
jgi:hypothetical protein